VSPGLEIAGVPAATKSLALIVDDPDAPSKVWVHWLLYDVPVLPLIEEGSAPGRQGRNDFGKYRYGGCCPPSGIHRYFFRLYALDRMLGLPERAIRRQVEAAMAGHVLDQAELMGTYSR
jgi:hypothetical protein